ncbi:MAG: hypothetical protein JNM63_11490 [Spirochaetia bacterium]|nr:hypothetical protein [Spirochaetia bacterium]
MAFRGFVILAALLVSFAPAREICSITGTAQKVAAKSVCCETACSHCEGKAAADKAKAAPLCMENDRAPALGAASLKALPDASAVQAVYDLPVSVSLATCLFNRASFVDSQPPFFSGRILLSVVLRS